MSSLPESEYYDYGHSKRGIALIITIREIPNEKPRHGAGKDHDLLVELFKKLEFDVREFRDLSREEILTEATKVSRDESLKESDCLVVAISTHGKTQVGPAVRDDSGYTMCDEVDMLWGKDDLVEVKEIFELFDETSCSNLKNKPKLFFLQGCRGTQLCETVQVRGLAGKRPSSLLTTDDHSDVTDATRSQDCFSTQVKLPQLPSSTLLMPDREDQDQPMEVEETPASQQMPSVSGDEDPGGDAMQMDPEEEMVIVSHRNDISRDYLAIWGSPPGYYAFHTKNGSPLFIHLHKVLLADHNKDDLLTMLTEVNYQVATTYESCTQDQETNKRRIVPSISHMLRKKVSLRTK